MVMPRAFAWTHFPRMAFSLALAQFSAYLHPVRFQLPCSLSSSSASPASWTHPDSVSQLLCSLPCCGVKAWVEVLWAGQP